MLRRHLREVLLQLILAYFPFLNYKPLRFKKAKASCTTNDSHLQFLRFLCCFLTRNAPLLNWYWFQFVLIFMVQRARLYFHVFARSFSSSFHDSLIYVHCHPIVIQCFNLRKSKIGESFRLFKLKTEGQTICKNSLQSYKTQIKIFANPGLV